MMSETAVCDACGAAVRDESLFCYNCGERVIGPPVNAHTAVAAPAEVIAQSKPVLVSRDAHAAVADVTEILPGSKPPLRSAASLRKQRRAFNRQPVEISWERPAGPGMGFIITTLVLAAGALVLILIALYLR